MRKRKAKKAAEPDRSASVQLRLGAGLIKRLDKAAWETGISRNTLVAEAVDKRLLNGDKRRRFPTSASELMAKRKGIMVRLDPVSVGLVDVQATTRRESRTIWIIDACLAALKQKGY